MERPYVAGEAVRSRGDLIMMLVMMTMETPFSLNYLSFVGGLSRLLKRNRQSGNSIVVSLTLSFCLSHSVFFFTYVV